MVLCLLGVIFYVRACRHISGAWVPVNTPLTLAVSFIVLNAVKP